MTWVKIDDHMADHPKLRGLGDLAPLALALQVRALCYASRYLTDGRIPAGVVPGLLDGFKAWGIETGGVPGLMAVGMDADEIDWPEVMIEAGLWHRLRNGDYEIHDYLDYNPPRETVLHEREANKKRQKKFRDRNAHRNGVSNGPVTGAPSPYPYPKEKTDGPPAPNQPSKPTSSELRMATLASACGITEDVVTGSDGKPIHRSDALKWWGRWRKGDTYRDDEIATVLRASTWAAKPWNPARVFYGKTRMEFEMMLERERKNRGAALGGLRGDLQKLGLLNTGAA